MRTTINLDDEVFATAQKFFGDLKTGELVNLALRKMVEREAASRLAKLGGSDPTANAPSRRSVSYFSDPSEPSLVAEDPPYLGK